MSNAGGKEVAEHSDGCVASEVTGEVTEARVKSLGK